MNIFLLTALVKIRSIKQVYVLHAHIFLYIVVLTIMQDKTPQQILIEYLDYIKRTIYKINSVNNCGLTEHDINDILQDVCVKLLHKGIAQYKGNSKFETYLYKIIYNEINDYLNKKSREEIVDENKFLKDKDDDDVNSYIKFFDYYLKVNIDYTNRIVINDIIHIIDDTLKTFDDKDILIFTWFFLCRKTQTQIATMLKLSQPTVFERIEKIRKIIITAIKEKYPTAEEELLS